MACNNCGSFPQGSVQRDNCSTCNPCKGSPCMDMCHERAELLSELSSFRNTLVYVEEDKKTYHVDCSGNPYAVSSGLIFEDNHVATAGQYSSVDIFDAANLKRYVYDPVGNVYSVAYTLEASV